VDWCYIGIKRGLKWSFFFISKFSFMESVRRPYVHWKYTTRNTNLKKEKETRNSAKLMDKGYKKAIDQRYSIWRNNSNTSSRDLSRFSKHLRFLSFQIHQKMQIGTIFHVVALLHLPNFHQQATRSSTLLGMTQEYQSERRCCSIERRPHHNA